MIHYNQQTIHVKWRWKRHPAGESPRETRLSTTTKVVRLAAGSNQVSVRLWQKRHEDVYPTGSPYQVSSHSLAYTNLIVSLYYHR